MSVQCTMVQSERKCFNCEPQKKKYKEKRKELWACASASQVLVILRGDPTIKVA